MRLLLALTFSLVLHVVLLGRQDGVVRSLSFREATPKYTPSVKASLTFRSNLQVSELSKAVEQDAVVAISQSMTKPEPHLSIPYPFLFDIYHSRLELTREPQVVEDVDLSAVALLDSRASGELAVELYINEQGRIDEVNIGPNELTALALEKLYELLMQLKFSSGEIDGQIVKTHLTIGVIFPRSDRQY